MKQWTLNICNSFHFATENKDKNIAILIKPSLLSQIKDDCNYKIIKKNKKKTLTIQSKTFWNFT